MSYATHWDTCYKKINTSKNNNESVEHLFVNPLLKIKPEKYLKEKC